MGDARAGRPRMTGAAGRPPGSRARAPGTALLLVDVLNDFAHSDGDVLQASFRERFAALEQLLSWARATGVPVVYANDALGGSRCCRESVVRRAIEGPLGELMAALAPAPGEIFVVKPLYSAFEQTGLDVTLHQRGVGTLLIAGSATERCVTQTVTGAVERDFGCTVVADACATVDPQLEEIALAYVKHVAGARVDHASSIAGACEWVAAVASA